MTTFDRDTTPDAFAFEPVTNAVFDIVYFSNEITVTVVNEETDIHIRYDKDSVPPIMGRYSINGGAFTEEDGTVHEGDKVRGCISSSIFIGTETVAELTIGGVSAIFSVTTFQ